MGLSHLNISLLPPTGASTLLSWHSFWQEAACYTITNKELL